MAEPFIEYLDFSEKLVINKNKFDNSLILIFEKNNKLLVYL